jgi:hypothetical protein
MSGAQYKTEKDCLNAGGKWLDATNKCEMTR